MKKPNSVKTQKHDPLTGMIVEKSAHRVERLKRLNLILERLVWTTKLLGIVSVFLLFGPIPDGLFVGAIIGVVISCLVTPLARAFQLDNRSELRQLRNRIDASSDVNGFFLLLRSIGNTTNLEDMGVEYSKGYPWDNKTYVAVDLISNFAEALRDEGKLIVVGGKRDPERYKRIRLRRPPIKAGDMLLKTETPIQVEQLSANVIWVRSNEQTWRDLVIKLFDMCKAVIIVPEISNGLREELRNLLKSKALDKTIIVMPAASSLSDARVVRWQEIRTRLIDDGIHLPEYAVRGLLYRPNVDFSVKCSRSLGSNHIHDIRRALQDLVSDLPPSRPLSAAFGTIMRAEQMMRSSSNDNV
jgi:hypothetical protein